MKIFNVIMFAFCIFVTTTTFAKQIIKPYMGINLVYDKINLKDNSDNFSGFTIKDFINTNHYGFNIYAGGQLNKYIAIEAFIQSTLPSTKKQTIDPVETKIKTSSFSYGFDNIAYFHIDDNISLLGTFGLEWFLLNTVAIAYLDGYSVQATESDGCNGYRLGIGTEYEISKNSATRFMVRYIMLDKSDIMPNLIDFSVGLRYMF